MVRHGSQLRTSPWAERSFAPLRMTENKRTGSIPVLDSHFICVGRSAPGLGRNANAQAILHPRGRNDEQWRKEEAKQRVQPDQRDVEAAKPKADPKGAKRTMSFQASAPDDF